MVVERLGQFTAKEVEGLPKLGPYEFSDQSVYIGQWKNGLKHGVG